jgi:PHD/YefM family antitoxin component YafN of YafNO toxin-antitoxin module
LPWTLIGGTFLRTVLTLKKPIMTVLTASEARANLYRLIDQAADSHEPIVIAGKRRSAVLNAGDDRRAIQETMHLLSVPGMRESIRAVMAEPLAKSAKELRW